MSIETIGQKATQLVALRKKIKEIEEQYDAILIPLKAEKESLDQEMIKGLVSLKLKSIKNADATISIAERKTLQVIDEDRVIEDLKAKGLTDLFKTQIVKPLWRGYSEKLAKEGKTVSGTEINTTTYISIRQTKKIN